MLKKTLLSTTVATFFLGLIGTQVVWARDDMWDLMDPTWWFDQFDDDDDDWEYWHYGPGRYGYYGAPYGYGFPPSHGYPYPQETEKKQPELPIPE